MRRACPFEGKRVKGYVSVEGIFIEIESKPRKHSRAMDKHYWIGEPLRNGN